MIKKLVVFLSLCTISTSNVFAANTTAQALQVVEAAISITKISDLNFGIAIQGDAEKTVAAGTTDNLENASFKILGEPNKAFQFSIPANSTVKMFLGGDTSLTDPTKIIDVEDFTSNLDGTTPTIDANGEKLLFVGATRAALLSNQTRGNYSGDFEVTVVY